jgi:hypothetical protein
MISEQNHKIFSLRPEDFAGSALEIFRWQSRFNPVYSSYIKALGIDAGAVLKLEEIPFLPIRFFRSHNIQTGEFMPALIFESSGTTGSVTSKHLVRDPGLYETSFTNTFELFYGPAKDWCLLGLLPSYLEKANSSLIYMVDRLIRRGGNPQSGFYLNDLNKLFEILGRLEAKKQKTLLIGVSFALLEFAEQYSLPLPNTVIMETGGMKGRREEITRHELHDRLKQAFFQSSIHSEYGMTELFSQAYSKGDGIFHSPPWMKVLLRDEEDPFTIQIPEPGKPTTGVINIIDLANRDSCSFIATDDAGRLHSDGSFEVLGRIDGSDLRGCSLMVV